MKVIFLDEDKAKAHEIKSQDLNQIFQLAEKMTVADLAKLQKVIDRLSKTKTGREKGSDELAE